MSEQKELALQPWLHARIKDMEEQVTALMHSRRPFWGKKRRQRIVKIAGCAGYIYACNELLDALESAEARSTNENAKSNAKKEAPVIPL